MKADDADEISAIQVSAWRRAYQDILPAQYLVGLDQAKIALKWRHGMELNSDLIRLVAILDKKIVGYAVGLESRHVAGVPAELYALYVDPAHWQKQVGAFLLKDFKQKLLAMNWHSFVVWTLEKNNIGRKFYEKQGGALTNHSKFFQVGKDEFAEVCYLFHC